MYKKLTWSFSSLLIICVFCILISCSEHKQQNAFKCTTELNEYLNINDCKYYKIKIGNHDVYQYTFGTYTGVGSDIIHFKDMCDFCKNNYDY